MRIGIFVALAVFAVACAKNNKQTEPAGEIRAKEGPASINQQLTGRSLTTQSNSNKSWTEHKLTATETGRPNATVIATAEFKTHKKFKDTPTTPIPGDGDCPAGTHKWGGELHKLTWTQTYDDGSGSFEGDAKIQGSKPVCTDGSEFLVEKVKGKIKKGTGDFEKVKGDWEASITVRRAKCDATGCPSEGYFKATNLTY